MKDNFSTQAATYAQFRPTYPSDLFDFILQNVVRRDSFGENKEIAWDCATGNGQAAKELTPHFDKVFATDISQKQLDNAAKADNIVYSVAKAEATDFADNSFDLITVAQAIHWFDFEKFYAEVRRVAKPNATLAVWGYGVMRFDSKEVDNLIQNFYHNIVGEYWDAERRHIDEHYSNVPFPFETIKTPYFEMTFNWHLYELEGYLNSWSSVQHFIKANGYNPVSKLMLDIEPIWGEFNREQVHFPIFLKIGKIN